MLQLTKFEPCPHCGRFDNRGTSVDLVIVSGDKILLGKRGRDPYKNHWGTLGGYVEWDETLEEAARRELKEETNLIAKKLTPLGVYSDTSRHPKQVITFAFAVEFEGEPLAGDDIDEVCWFDLNNIPTPLAFDHQEIINDYLKKNI